MFNFKGRRINAKTLCKWHIETGPMRILMEHGTGRAIFEYQATNDVSFAFDMLCEVGQPWIPEFEKVLDMLGYRLEHFEDPDDDTSFGIYDKLVPIENTEFAAVADYGQDKWTGD
jgi:hypothetical protein